MRSVTTEPRILPGGDAALVVEFGDAVDPALNTQVLALDARVATAAIPGVLETVPSFRSLLVLFDPLVTDGESVASALRTVLSESGAASTAPARRWRLPCCYDGDLAPDLDAVAEATGLAPAGVIERHAETEFRVYMVGFLPGAPYLGDLPPELALPRLSEPRIRVPAGSVAIAMGLSVVYPVESPGGWRLIGRTPAPLFAIDDDPPALLAPGDRLRFDPVSRAEYDQLLAAATAGDWRPEAETVR